MMGVIGYYTAINKYSDLTEKEAEQMLTGDLQRQEDQLTDDLEAQRLLSELIGLDDDDSVVSLHGSQVKLSRRKRSAEDPQFRGLSESDVIRPPVDDATSQANNLKIKWIVPTNNPDYEPSAEQKAMSESLPQSAVFESLERAKDISTLR